MALQGFFDGIPILVLFLSISALMIAVFELAYSVVVRFDKKQNKAQIAQVRAIMGAALGLLAFMLAFTFSKAQEHFEARVDAYLLEVSAVDATYRSAEFLDDERKETAKGLIRDFVQVRVDIARDVKTEELGVVFEHVKRGEQIHGELWDVAVSSKESGNAIDDDGYASAVLEMVRANEERLQATLYNRISPVIWITLIGMAMLAMIVMGYQARLTGARSKAATWTLAFAFAAVMALVSDLDRPQMSLFDFDQSMLVKLQQRVSE